MVSSFSASHFPLQEMSGYNKNHYNTSISNDSVTVNGVTCGYKPAENYHPNPQLFYALHSFKVHFKCLPWGYSLTLLVHHQQIIIDCKRHLFRARKVLKLPLHHLLSTTTADGHSYQLVKIVEQEWGASLRLTMSSIVSNQYTAGHPSKNLQLIILLQDVVPIAFS